MIDVLPYSEVNGCRTLPDTALIYIWDRLTADGTVQTVFSECEMTTAQHFIELYKDGRNLPAFVLVDGKIGGIGWVNGVQKDRAFAHYAFFKEHWGKNTLGMAKALMDYWFRPEFPFYLLLGQTPTWNRKAVKFLGRIGWTIAGELPATPKGQGIVISYCTREHFYGQ
jgi:hypothetical protein